MIAYLRRLLASGLDSEPDEDLAATVWFSLLGLTLSLAYIHTFGVIPPG